MNSRRSCQAECVGVCVYFWVLSIAWLHCRRTSNSTIASGTCLCQLVHLATLPTPKCYSNLSHKLRLNHQRVLWRYIRKWGLTKISLLSTKWSHTQGWKDKVLLRKDWYLSTRAYTMSHQQFTDCQQYKQSVSLWKWEASLQRDAGTMPRGKEWQKKPQQLLFGQQMRYRYSDTKKSLHLSKWNETLDLFFFFNLK